LQATLPLDEYEFTSPLLGFRKSKKGYSGWYAPAASGRWAIALNLPSSEKARMRHVEINDSAKPLPISAGAILIIGGSTPGRPLRWEVS
jgi:hypothetical protein